MPTYNLWLHKYFYTPDDNPQRAETCWNFRALIVKTKYYNIVQFFKIIIMYNYEFYTLSLIKLGRTQIISCFTFDSYFS